MKRLWLFKMKHNKSILNESGQYILAFSLCKLNSSIILGSNSNIEVLTLLWSSYFLLWLHFFPTTTRSFRFQSITDGTANPAQKCFTTGLLPGFSWHFPWKLVCCSVQYFLYIPDKHHSQCSISNLFHAFFSLEPAEII